MKNRVDSFSLVAVAMLLAGLITSAPAITIRKMNGSRVEVHSLYGTVTHVDQNQRSFTIHWQLKGLLSMEHFYPSYEDTYRVTEGTVYKNGSWANIRKGIVVVISGHSDVADTVQFINAASGQQGANMQSAGVYNQRGFAMQQKGDLAGALAEYNEAIKLDPRFAPAYNNRGVIKFNRGDLAGALADYNRTIEIDAKYFRGYNNIGLIKFRKGDLDGAIAEYDHAIALNPNYGQAYRNRGEARRKKGDLEGATADFNRASKLRGVSNL